MKQLILLLELIILPINFTLFSYYKQNHMKVPSMAEMMAAGEMPEILFWVGCAGSFDQRAQKITKAFATILDKVGMKFAILGKEEACTGDPARRAGNEFLFFENKDIRAANNTIARIDSKGGLYNAYLYLSQARANSPYTYYPDINGNYIVKNIGRENNEIEADYAWVFFSLSAPAFYEKKSIFSRDVSVTDRCNWV